MSKNVKTKEVGPANAKSEKTNQPKQAKESKDAKTVLDTEPKSKKPGKYGFDKPKEVSPKTQEKILEFAKRRKVDITVDHIQREFGLDADQSRSVLNSFVDSGDLKMSGKKTYGLDLR